MATIYEALTPSKLPGARTVISWNPSRITDAMRKRILGRLTNPTKYRGGGWSAVSEDAFRVCCKAMKIPYISSRGSYSMHVSFNGVRNQEAIEVLRPWVLAFAAANRIGEGDSRSVYSNWRLDYNVNKAIPNLYSEGSAWFYLDDFCTPAHDALLEFYKDELAAAAPLLERFLVSDQELIVGDFVREPRKSKPKAK